MRSLCLTLAFGLALFGADVKPTTASTPKPKPVAAKAATGTTCEQVARMLEAKISESLIRKQISGKKFNLSADDMIRLKSAGASDDLLVAMTEGSPAPAPVARVAPAPPPGAMQFAPSAPAAVPAAPPALAAPVIPTAPAAPAPAVAAAKKRVAVEDFDYSTVRTAAQEIFKNDQNLGRGIRAMLTHRITQGGILSVVERAKINTLIGEQDFGVSGRVKQGTNARIGKIKGAEAILMGDIVAFGRDDRQKKVKLGGMFGKWGDRVGGAFSQWGKEDKAVVVITYRLVDAETSEVITTGEARGESMRKSKGWGGLLAVSGAAVGAGMSVESSNFAQTIIGEATQDCVNHLAEILNGAAPKLAARKIEIDARVADVSGASLIINAGGNDGVQVGDRFSVERIINEVRDPVTKEVLDVKTQRVGEMVITAVRDKVSTGSYSGVAPAQVNDAAIKQN